MSEENNAIVMGGKVDEDAPKPEETTTICDRDNGSTEITTPYEPPVKAYIPTPTEVQAVVDQKPEQVKKKTGKAVKTVFGIIGSLIFIIVLAAVALFFMLTYDDMPRAPETTSTMSSIATKAVTSLIGNSGRLEFSTNDLNCIYYKIQPSIQEAVAESGAELTESFIVLSDNTMTLYARVRYKGINLPARINLSLSYRDPYVVIVCKSATVGKFTIPNEIINAILARVELPEYTAFIPSTSEITYDTTSFNKMIVDELLSENKTVNDIESFIDGLAGIFGKDFEYEQVIDVQISDFQVIENKLVFVIEQIFG